MGSLGYEPEEGGKDTVQGILNVSEMSSVYGGGGRRGATKGPQGDDGGVHGVRSWEETLRSCPPMGWGPGLLTWKLGHLTWFSHV